MMSHNVPLQIETPCSNPERNVKTDTNRLQLDTGSIQGVWHVTKNGVYLQQLAAGEMCITPYQAMLPWYLPDLLSAHDQPQFVESSRFEVVNDPHQPDHEKIEFVFSYTKLDLRYQIWSIPDAPGFRTQVSLRCSHQPLKDEFPSWLGNSFVERVAIDPVGAKGLAAGYYNDTQHRNYDHTPILRTERWEKLSEEGMCIDWSNLISVGRERSALTLVKESNRTVNQSGIDSGAFVLEPGSVGVTGLGLCDHTYSGGAAWHDLEGWQEAWATWMILSEPNELAVQTAVKQMDRCRYPFRPERDEMIVCNTWGSGGAGEGSRAAACESVVLKELESAADLGIDLVQIDDGWQCEPEAENPTCTTRDWQPHPSRWPNGWDLLKKRASELGVDLGLWFNWSVAVEKMIANGKQAGFGRFKLDFLDARNRAVLEQALGKAKNLTRTLGPRSGVNWDCTEAMSRMGYFYGREVGNLYLSNRSVGRPRLRHTEFKPHLQLRDTWHLAHYLNLNQFQLTVQDVAKLTDREGKRSGYSHAYAFATAMLGLPILFQLTQMLETEARDELRPFIKIYRQHRRALHAGTVFPIGAMPNGKQWSGFQIHDRATGTGYLLLFREIGCDESTCHMELSEVIQPDSTWELLYSNSTQPVLNIDADGKALAASSEVTASFSWYHYQRIADRPSSFPQQ
ncbi:MAG: alpha-galactosidase [Verrucomicrobiota bacterium]